jgi:hypothetical protein
MQTNANVYFYHSGGNGVGNNFFYSESDNAPLHLLGNALNFGGCLGFCYEVQFSDFVSKELYDQALLRISTLEGNKNIISSPNGTKYQIKVNDNGVLSTKALGVYNKVFVFGNSYTANYVTDFWWHTGSMAVTRREYSWWYLLNNMLSVASPNIQTIAKNAYEFDQGWEQKLDNADLTGLDTLLGNNTDIDLIIIQVGANVTDTQANYKTALEHLIENHFLSYCPNATLVFTNMAAGNYGGINYEVSQEYSGIWVDVNSVTVTHPTVDTVIYDENNVGHTIASGTNPSGVVGHPDDAYFDAVSQIFFNILSNS